MGKILFSKKQYEYQNNKNIRCKVSASMSECLDLILVAHQELYFNKPKADRKSNSQKKKVKIEADEVLHSDKIVRAVGGIKMTSEKPPRMPSKESVVKYKTAVWGRVRWSSPYEKRKTCSFS